MADELREEAAKNGVVPGKSGTPHDARNRVTKPSTPSTGRSNKSVSKSLATPSKSGSRKTMGDSLIDAISLDDDVNTSAQDSKPKSQVKTENAVSKTAGVIPSIESEAQPAPVDTISKSVDAFSTNQDDVFVGAEKEESAFVTSIRSRRSAAPPQDSDSDEYMDSGEESPSSPTPQGGRSGAQSRLTRARGAPRRRYVFEGDSEDEEV